MIKKSDWLGLTAAIIGVAVMGEMINEHIDKTEDSKKWRIFKKVGLGALAFAIGGILVDISMAGNLARDMYDGNINFKLIEERKA